MLLGIESPPDGSPGGLVDTLMPSSAEGSRALLSAIISSMITAVSVTFSVTIVALTVAAQHFGPRVLNNFVRHRAAQLVLGTFIATFIYAVLVLGAVSTDGPLPRIAVTGAVLLVLLSVGALIYYVHHIASALQVGELTAEIARDLIAGLSPQEATRLKKNSHGALPRDAGTILSLESGYVQRIDFLAIAAIASARNARVWIRREPGTFALAGAALAVVEPKTACDVTFTECVQEACVVGPDRTQWHDPEFSAKQLVEVALRALSPGVNEPFTALTCIDRLSEGLATALRAPPPREWWADESGTDRVFARPQSFETLLRASLDPIRLFAGRNPAVYARLADTLGELGAMAERCEDREVLREQLHLVRLAVGEAFQERYEKNFLEARIGHAAEQLQDGGSANRG